MKDNYPRGTLSFSNLMQFKKELQQANDQHFCECPICQKAYLEGNYVFDSNGMLHGAEPLHDS